MIIPDDEAEQMLRDVILSVVWMVFAALLAGCLLFIAVVVMWPS